jgi:hypothetical protein
MAGALLTAQAASASNRQTPTAGPALDAPGLSAVPVVPVPGASPTLTQCLNAWNVHAPRLTLRWLVDRGPSGALVAVSQTFFHTGGSTTKPTTLSGPACSFFVYYGKSKLLIAHGVWKNGTVSAWSGDLENLRATPRLNASVASDGTLRLL